MEWAMATVTFGAKPDALTQSQTMYAGSNKRRAMGFRVKRRDITYNGSGLDTYDYGAKQYNPVTARPVYVCFFRFVCEH